ncbi:MAG: hypothetical protein IPJ60_18715 [Sphingobacteriaceae bacterium]|nr:hypothetical protein [Sphingobacteriaceae bacterium]
MVRYFGGKTEFPTDKCHIKWPPMISLDKDNIITVPIKESYIISLGETDMPMVMHELNKSGAHIMATDFGEICNFRIEFERANAEKILSKLKTIKQIIGAYFCSGNSWYFLSFLFQFFCFSSKYFDTLFQAGTKLAFNDQNEVENYVLQFHPELFSSNSDLQLIWGSGSKKITTKHVLHFSTHYKEILAANSFY